MSSIELGEQDALPAAMSDAARKRAAIETSRSTSEHRAAPPGATRSAPTIGCTPRLGRTPLSPRPRRGRSAPKSGSRAGRRGPPARLAWTRHPETRRRNGRAALRRVLAYEHMLVARVPPYVKHFHPELDLAADVAAALDHLGASHPIPGWTAPQLPGPTLRGPIIKRLCPPPPRRARARAAG
jgi:hypothetical protein